MGFAQMRYVTVITIEIEIKACLTYPQIRSDLRPAAYVVLTRERVFGWEKPLAKLTKRVVDAAEARDKDYVIWDDELPGFGLRVFTSGKRSYVLQYRSLGRSRRYTIGLHGVWTAESARQEAKVQLGRVAQGDNPAEERQLDHKAITVKELCTLYVNDLNVGLILGADSDDAATLFRFDAATPFRDDAATLGGGLVGWF
jgi:hypothetical protein